MKKYVINTTQGDKFAVEEDTINKLMNSPPAEIYFLHFTDLLSGQNMYLNVNYIVTISPLKK